MPETTLSGVQRTSFEDAPPTMAPPPRRRLVALDAFRGLTILLMVLVNNGNGTRSYGQLEHSDWHGLTLTDTVFPSFLFIVGVAITLSLQVRLETQVAKRTLLLQIAKRAAILFALGLLFNLFPDFNFAGSRLLGVLQRIAICYFCAAAIYLYTGTRAQIVWIAGLFTAYWFAMTWLPVPGYGHGRLDVDGNFAHFIDRIVLGVHNYRSPNTWDPEGIVSTLPSVGTVLLGIMAGHVLRLKTAMTARLCSLFFTGTLLLLLGLFWSNWMPINKKIWTDTFALVMAGIDFLLLGSFIWFVDELGYERLVKPLVIVGMNSIAVYTASELGIEIFNLIPAPGMKNGGSNNLPDYLFNHLYAPALSPENASLFWALTITALMFALAYALYRRRWFWRV